MDTATARSAPLTFGKSSVATVTWVFCFFVVVAVCRRHFVVVVFVVVVLGGGREAQKQRVLRALVIH